MKSQHTMLAIAKQQAFERVDNLEDYANKIDDQVVFGYWLSYMQLCRIYYANGFSEAALKKHLERWEVIGAIRILNRSLIYFIPNKDEIQSHYLEQERKRFPDALIVSEASA